MRRILRGAVLAGALLATLVAIAPPTSGKASDDTSRADAWGWWHRDQVVLGLGVPNPDGVPDGGLQVATDLLGQRAIAALRVAVPAGRRPLLLRLDVADRRGTADVLACHTTSSWRPTGGAGAWAERPDVDCSSSRPAVIDGDELLVDLDGFVAPDQSIVDLALVVAGGSDEVVTLARPGPQAFTFSSTTVPSVTSTSTAPTTTAAPPPPPPPTSPPTTRPVTTSRPDTTTGSTSPVPMPTVAPTTPPTSASPPVVDPSSPGAPAPGGDDTSPVQRPVAAAVAAALFALWGWLRFGGGVAVVEQTPDEKGIGRFAAVRPDGPPPRL